MGRLKNGKTWRGKRSMVSPKYDVDDGPVTGREDCPHPHKHAYGSRAAAKRARQRFSQGKGTRLSIYLCICQNWHLGKLPSVIKHGKATRDGL